MYCVTLTPCSALVKLQLLRFYCLSQLALAPRHLIVVGCGHHHHFWQVHHHHVIINMRTTRKITKKNKEDNNNKDNDNHKEEEKTFAICQFKQSSVPTYLEFAFKSSPLHSQKMSLFYKSIPTSGSQSSSFSSHSIIWSPAYWLDGFTEVSTSCSQTKAAEKLQFVQSQLTEKES